MTTEPVTIEQAAALMNVSASTIRRRIRAGTLQVTETHRPQGVVWLVHLPPGVRPAAATDTVGTAPVDTTPSTDQPAGHSVPAPSEAVLALVQTTIGTVLGPLVAELAAGRQMIERQAEQLVTQAEALGRVTAERDALALRYSVTDRAAESPVSEPSTVTPAATVRRRWGPWLLAMLAGIVLLAGAGVWLLLWPR